jgi:hypothetical protein
MMTACERCWNDAFTAAAHRGTAQADEYAELVAARDCTPEQAAGEHWDAERGVDRRPAG